MTQRTVQMVEENQRNTLQRKSDTTTNHEQSKEQGEGKVGFHIAEPPLPTNNDSIDMGNTDETDLFTEMNAYTNNNHDETDEPTETQSTMGEPVAHVGLALGCNNYILLAEEAWDEINHDRLQANVDSLCYNNAVQTNGYAMMAIAVDKDETQLSNKDSVQEMMQLSVVEHSDGDISACTNDKSVGNKDNVQDSVSSTDGTNDNDLDPGGEQDQGVEHSEDLLDHALYCALCGGCTILAEGWYEVIHHKLRMSGIKDSSMYYAIHNGQEWGIWQALNDGSYSTTFKHNIQSIHSSIKDVFEGQDKIHPVSFRLEEDDRFLGHGYEEQCLMEVLWSSCMLMEWLWPKHWCNSVLQRLCKVNCNSVCALKTALEHNNLNKHLEAANCPMFLCSTAEIISKALLPGMPEIEPDLGTNDSDSHMQDFCLDGR